MKDEGYEKLTKWADCLTELGHSAGAAGSPSAIRTRPIASTLMTQMTLTHGQTPQRSSTHPVNPSQWTLTQGKESWGFFCFSFFTLMENHASLCSNQCLSNRESIWTIHPSVAKKLNIDFFSDTMKLN